MVVVSLRCLRGPGPDFREFPRDDPDKGDFAEEEGVRRMPLKPWKKLSESIAVRNPYWTYKRDAFELPSGKPGEYHYVHTNGSSMVVPIVGDGSMLLVNQYRYLLGRESREFPCGSVKEGSTHEETARQELEEETGYSAKSLLMGGAFNP